MITLARLWCAYLLLAIGGAAMRLARRLLPAV
jgi:hypothetical protein